MASYVVKEKSFINGKLVQAGDVVELDSKVSGNLKKKEAEKESVKVDKK